MRLGAVFDGACSAIYAACCSGLARTRSAGWCASRSPGKKERRGLPVRERRAASAAETLGGLMPVSADTDGIAVVEVLLQVVFAHSTAMLCFCH